METAVNYFYTHEEMLGLLRLGYLTFRPCSFRKGEYLKGIMTQKDNTFLSDFTSTSGNRSSIQLNQYLNDNVKEWQIYCIQNIDNAYGKDDVSIHKNKINIQNKDIPEYIKNLEVRIEDRDKTIFNLSESLTDTDKYVKYYKDQFLDCKETLKIKNELHESRVNHIKSELDRSMHLLRCCNTELQKLTVNWSNNILRNNKHKPDEVLIMSVNSFVENL